MTSNWVLPGQQLLAGVVPVVADEAAGAALRRDAVSGAGRGPTPSSGGEARLADSKAACQVCHALFFFDSLLRAG